MLRPILFAAQIILLVVIGIFLWQIRKFLNRKDIPDDEPIGEAHAKALNKKLTLLMICFAAEAVVSVAQAILRFIDGS